LDVRTHRKARKKARNIRIDFLRLKPLKKRANGVKKREKRRALPADVRLSEAKSLRSFSCFKIDHFETAQFCPFYVTVILFLCFLLYFSIFCWTFAFAKDSSFARAFFHFFVPFFFANKKDEHQENTKRLLCS